MQSILLGEAINRLRQIETIDAMNHLKQRESMTDLVLLKVTDEMPTKMSRQKGNLSACFLHFTFAENKLTGTDCFADDLCCVCLGNGDQLHVRRVSSGHLRRLSNLISHAVEVCFDVDHSLQSEHSSSASSPAWRSSWPIVIAHS